MRVISLFVALLLVVSAKKACQLPKAIFSVTDAPIQGIIKDKDTFSQFTILASGLDGNAIVQNCKKSSCDKEVPLQTVASPTAKYGVSEIPTNGYETKNYVETARGGYYIYNTTGQLIETFSPSLSDVYIDSAIYQGSSYITAVAGYDRVLRRTFVHIYKQGYRQSELVYKTTGSRVAEDKAQLAQINSFIGIRYLAGFLWYDGVHVRVLSCAYGDCSRVNISTVVPPAGEMRSMASAKIDREATVFLNVDGKTFGYSCAVGTATCKVKSSISFSGDVRFSTRGGNDGYFLAVSGADSNDLYHCFDDLCINNDKVTGPAGELWFIPLNSEMHALIIAKDGQYMIGIDCKD